MSARVAINTMGIADPLGGILVFKPGDRPDLCSFMEVGKLKPKELGQECFIANDITTEKARRIAVKKVAAHFGVTEEQAVESFDICILPGSVCGDYILARRKV